MPTVFLSYANEKRAIAKRISSWLENSPNVQIWMDKNELSGGKEWENEIRTQIENADYFVPLLSEGFSNPNRFAHREVRIAIKSTIKHPNNRPVIIPTRIEDCQIPFIELRKLHCIDLHIDTSNAFHKLYSALDRYGEYVGESEIRLTSHQAVFKGNPDYLFYFVTIANLTKQTVVITHIHYRDPFQYVNVSPRSRILPQKLEAAEVWATFLPKEKIPADFREEGYDKFFVRLSNGNVYRSRKEESVFLEGSVPGGPIYRQDIEVQSSENVHE